MRVHPLAELCIKAVDEETIAGLNAQWMEKEGVTDVLAFPMDELRPGLVNEEPEEGVLGDLVLCPAVAERQGETAGHGTLAEVELLTVHGILHLLGYDHAEPEEHAGDVRPAGPAARRVAGRSTRTMTSADVWLVVAAAALVVLAGLFSAADAALSSASRARADELLADGRAGARRLTVLLGRPGPLPQHRALPAPALRDRGDGDRHPAGPQRLGRCVLGRRAAPRSGSCWSSRSW